MYRDYRDKDVQFFYVYKSVEHSEVNNFVSAFTVEERLKHIAIAKERFQSEIPWICDTLDNEVKYAFGSAPNGEFILDPEGKIVRKRFWSDPKTLRSDLEELVGKSDTLTKVEDLPTAFTPEPNVIASGVVPRVEIPAGMLPLKITPKLDEDNPFFAKLRVEASRELMQTGMGKIYFGVYLDPIYNVHWNNRAGKVKLEIDYNDSMMFHENELESDDVEVDADIDPRQFLVEAATEGRPAPLKVKLTYTVCDDAETFCKEITQHYTINPKPNRDLGTRPGVFLNGLFANLDEMDKNKDGDLTVDELPPGKVTLYIGHMDANGNEVIEKSEIERFRKMFNNGRGITPYNDGDQPKETDDQSNEKNPIESKDSETGKSKTDSPNAKSDDGPANDK